MTRLILCIVPCLGLLLWTSSATEADGGQEATVLDTEVKLVSFADIEYPMLAKRARVQGVVVVRAGLDDKGNVESASAISGSDAFIPDCLANARKWKFQPNRMKVAVIVYEFRFSAGACHDDSKSLFALRHKNFASITACDPVIR